MSTEKFNIPKKYFPIGRRLKIYLDTKAIKAVDLARETGIGKATISEAINGISDLKGRKIELIIRHTDLNPIWFITGEGEMTRAEIQADEKDSELADLLGKTRRILISNHSASAALKSNILCFFGNYPNGRTYPKTGSRNEEFKKPRSPARPRVQARRGNVIYVGGILSAPKKSGQSSRQLNHRVPVTEQ